MSISGVVPGVDSGVFGWEGCVPIVYPGKLNFDRSFNLNLNPELYPELYPELNPELVSATLYRLSYCFCSRFGYFAFLDRGLVIGSIRS